MLIGLTIALQAPEDVTSLALNFEPPFLSPVYNNDETMHRKSAASVVSILQAVNCESPAL